MNNIEYLKKYYEGNIDDAIKRLELGEAVQYIVGNVDFYGYKFKFEYNVPVVSNEKIIPESNEDVPDE